MQVPEVATSAQSERPVKYQQCDRNIQNLTIVTKFADNI